MDLIREDREDKISKSWVWEVGKVKDEFKCTPRFLPHVAWVGDGAILGEKEPVLIKKRISCVGLVHDGTWWHKCSSYPCTGRAREVTELGW